MFLLLHLKVIGHSMEPTYKSGDTVFASSLPYLFESPKIRDVIVFKDPKSKKLSVKRIQKIQQDKYYFVVGDNSNDSQDSRVFGWIEKRDIIGRVVYKISNY